MTKQYHFYGKNTFLLEDKTVNCTFGELTQMSNKEFREWCIALRKLVVKIWDEKGIPPRSGYSKEEILDQFNNLINFPVHKMLSVDQKTGKKECITNNFNDGNAANSWFPTMMKTRISYGSKGEGRSIYDYFATDELFENHYKALYRNFKTDGFYHYGPVVESQSHDYLIFTDDAKDWIEKFETQKRKYETHDYWLQYDLGKDYTGNSKHVTKRSFLTLEKNEIVTLVNENILPEHTLKNVYEKYEISCVADLPSEYFYKIRLYEKSERLFPKGYKAFRVALCQYAVNFPPLVAKFLYEEHTKEFKDKDQIVIWDPSAGWGGRILGAMSVRPDRNIHYIGTDPNTDHNLPDGRTKYHDLADFYNNETNRTFSLFPHQNTYEIFQCGSEEMHKQKAFQKYKGKVQIVFTSPPYFCREIYSDDKEQSCHKFKQYEDWRKGFLERTLQTAVEWLSDDGYLLWNIADLKIGKSYLPLEKDSCDILKKLGMKQVNIWKLAMAPMPGAGRKSDEDSTFKNSCLINGNLLKFEPIFVYKRK